MTYSIVARDPETGDLGGAVQSHWFGAGDVLWADPGVGMVASQAISEPSYGPLGLDQLRSGATPEQALAVLTAADEGAGHRQVGVVDHVGRVAAHTGTGCIAEAGHRLGDGYSCQANMMLRDTVWDAMASAFEGVRGDLAGRLLSALEAAEAEGGDVRGRQAARILVVRAEPSGRSWTDVLVDLRVDDHPAPLEELRRLLHLKRAYDRLEAAEHLELAGDLDAAFEEQRAAMAALGDNPEAAFWLAISLAANDRLDEARATMRVALASHHGWLELLRRLARDGFPGMDRAVIARLLPQQDG